MYSLSENKKIQLSEGWGVSPDNLSPAGRINGTTLYSSDELKKQVATILLTKSKTFKPVQKSIIKLLKRNIIVPCFTTRSFLKFMLLKFMKNQTIEDVYGMFDAAENKVYIFLDNNVSTFLNRVNIDDLNTVLIHELMHYASYNKSSMFLSKTKSIIFIYYKQFFSMLDFNLPNNVLTKYIKWLFINFEKKIQFKNNSLINYKSLLDNTMINYYTKDKKNGENTINNIIYAIYLYLTNFQQFSNSVQTALTPERNIVINLFKSYSSINVTNPKTFPIQELLFPSEIIAIYSQEKQNSLTWKIIKGI